MFTLHFPALDSGNRRLHSHTDYTYVQRGMRGRVQTLSTSKVLIESKQRPLPYEHSLLSQLELGYL